jgi:glycogenin glucosyltransferase
MLVLDIKSVLFMAFLEAFVSLATNDFYAKGALALGHSIRQTHTSRRLALLVTNSISPEMR